MIELTIYSRAGCHLCHELKEVVNRVVAQLPPGTTVVNEVDISTNAALERAYGEEIPVLLIDGRKSAKYRITEAELKRRLNR